MSLWHHGLHDNMEGRQITNKISPERIPYVRYTKGHSGQGRSTSFKSQVWTIRNVQKLPLGQPAIVGKPSAGLSGPLGVSHDWGMSFSNWYSWGNFWRVTRIWQFAYTFLFPGWNDSSQDKNCEEYGNNYSTLNGSWAVLNFVMSYCN